MTETTPFEHKMTPRHTEFRISPELTDVTIQDVYNMRRSSMMLRVMR